MKRGTLLYLVGALLLLVLLLQVFTGFLLWLAIPAPTPGANPGVREAFMQGRRLEEEFLWIGRHDWGEIHRWAAIPFLMLMGVHLLLNQRWIVSITRNLLPGKGRPGRN